MASKRSFTNAITSITPDRWKVIIDQVRGINEKIAATNSDKEKLSL